VVDRAYLGHLAAHDERTVAQARHRSSSTIDASTGPERWGAATPEGANCRAGLALPPDLAA
jgi:hypothetical protein